MIRHAATQDSPQEAEHISRIVNYLSGTDTRYPLSESLIYGTSGHADPVGEPRTEGPATDTVITTSGGLLAQIENANQPTYSSRDPLTYESLRSTIDSMFGQSDEIPEIHYMRTTPRWRSPESFQYYTEATGMSFFNTRIHIPGPGASQHKAPFNPLKTLKLV